MSDSTNLTAAIAEAVKQFQPHKLWANSKGELFTNESLAINSETGKRSNIKLVYTKPSDGVLAESEEAGNGQTGTGSLGKLLNSGNSEDETSEEEKAKLEAEGAEKLASEEAEKKAKKDADAAAKAAEKEAKAKTAKTTK